MAALERSPFMRDCKILKSVLLSIDLEHLKELEDHILSSNCHHSPHLKDFTFDGFTALGTTPLILACQHGELDSVKHIVESWRVDVRDSAPFYSNPSQQSVSTIKEATPLFVAALYGHDKTVRYLLEKGANVSVKTSHNHRSSEHDGLTPLYAAVSDRQYNSRKPLPQQREDRTNIVLSLLEFGADPVADTFRPSDGQPIWMETMCGVDAIAVLIDHGLDLKRRNPSTGETLLHSVASRSRYFTEEDSLTIVQLLVEKGADLLARDNFGFTPLLRAADDKNDDGRLNLSVFEVLLERDEYSRIEKIEAMELIGATILFRAANAPYFPKAFYYWNRALRLRHQMERAAEHGSPSSKKMLGRKIGRHVEWTTFAELDQLKEQQENCPSEALEDMDYLDTFHEVDTQMQHPDEYTVQALLVKLRILSGLDGQRHHSLSTQYIDYITCSNTLDYDEKFTRILDIKWGMFDLVIYRLVPHPSDRFLWIRIVKDIEKLVSTLSALEEFKTHPRLLTFEKLKTSLDLILLATDRSPITIINVEHVVDNDEISDYGSRFTESLSNLLEMIFRLPSSMLNKRDTTSLIQSLRLLGSYRLGILLFSRCQVLGNLKALSLVRVLLDAGADPNVSVDELHGNASLHVVAGFNCRQLGDVAGLLLVEFGASLHQVNKAGKTALDIWIEINETEDNWDEETGGWSARPEWCCPLPSLLRLAARVIRVHKIPYADGKTPANLHSLIELR